MSGIARVLTLQLLTFSFTGSREGKPEAISSYNTYVKRFAEVIKVNVW
jgi:hypothetical protein